jgi:putative membrane protein
MKIFLKSIIVGIGGVSPGLSGSVLLVMFGLYERVIGAIGGFFKDIKKNLLFLIPVFGGFFVGVFLFSKLIDLLLSTFPMQTRFAFLGLVIGAIPLFWREIRKKGFSKKYYLFIAISCIVGLALLILSKGSIDKITEPNIFQSVFLGFSVAASYIIPGVDSAVILSALGIYELYVSSISSLDFSVLIPAAVGLGIGALSIAFIMTKLLSKFYTATYSVIFGLFISIIPSVLDESCKVALDLKTAASIIFAILGFFVSFYLSDIKKNNEKIKKLFEKKAQ